MGRFLAAIGLGLSTSLSCVLTCLPVYLPFSLTRQGARDWKRVSMLLSGRLAAYVLTGAAAGALGSAFSATTVARFSAIAIVPLAILLFLRAAGLFSGEIPFCGVLSSIGERIRSPLLVGFLLGFSVCYPFLIAIAVAASSGGWTPGIVVFTGFFIGTSVFLVPLFFLPLIRGSGLRERLFRLSSALAAVLALFYMARALDVLIPQDAGRPVATRADVEMLFPDASEVESAVNAVPAHFRAFSGSGTDKKLQGYAVSSTECAPGIIGYAGPIPVLLGLDPEGRILSVKMLQNHETASYVSRLFSAESLHRLTGKSYKDPWRIGKDVDAVTGATVSQAALIRTVQATLHAFSVQVLHQEPVASPGSPETAWIPALTAFLLLAALSVVMAHFRLPWRRWFLLLTVAVAGIAFPLFPGIADLARILFGVPMSQAETIPRTVMIVVVLGITLTLGRHFCSFLCPYGALQELIHTISPLRREISPRLDRALRGAKYVILAALPFLFALRHDFSVLAFEPFTPTFRALTSLPFLRDLWSLQPLLFFLVLLLLPANLLTERFYCKYLCPLGALFALLSAARILPRRAGAPGRTCRGCSKGLPDFPSECFQCGGIEA